MDRNATYSALTTARIKNKLTMVVTVEWTSDNIAHQRTIWSVSKDLDDQ